jgi:hypothetical protein
MDCECSKKILASKIEEGRTEWSRWLNEKSHNLYSSPYLIRVIRSERTRWIGCGEMRNQYTLIGIREGTRPFVVSLRNAGRGSKKMNIKEMRSDVQTGFNWLKTGSSNENILIRPWVPLELVNILVYWKGNHTLNDCSMKLCTIHVSSHLP